MSRPRKSSPAIAGPPPRKREGPGGFILSAFVHATIVLLLITSPFSHGFTAAPAELGGGPGPTGGGGGRSGSGSDAERLRFIQTRPAAAPPTPAPALVPAPPITKPVPSAVTAAATQPATAVPASGTATSGEGTAGTGGAGPGTGGGTGSGTGTGRGSSVGPGTGGGDGLNHPPTPTQVFLPPLPAPPRIKPYHLIAWFDVDERGNAKLLSFNPSRDGSYNRRLREVLMALKFRPGVTAAGVPVRDTIDIQFVF
jgi:periplasmic protein TonB